MCVHVFLLSYNLVYSVHVYVCVCVCVCVCAVDLLFVRVRDIYICGTLTLYLQYVSLFCCFLFSFLHRMQIVCVCVE